MNKISDLPCSKCGAEALAEYDYTPDGERVPAWQCLSIDCGYRET